MHVESSQRLPVQPSCLILNSDSLRYNTFEAGGQVREAIEETVRHFVFIQGVQEALDLHRLYVHNHNVSSYDPMESCWSYVRLRDSAIGFVNHQIKNYVNDCIIRWHVATLNSPCYVCHFQSLVQAHGTVIITQECVYNESLSLSSPRQ